MRQDQLPSPGLYFNSQKLRVEASKALSHAEIMFDLNGQTSTDAIDQLRDFFQACADAVPTTIVPPAE